jgi:ribonuclease P protein component
VLAPICRGYLISGNLYRHFNSKQSIVSKQFTLGKSERLKSRKQIDHLFNDGQRFNLSFFRVFYSIANSSDVKDTPLQAGFAAGSRNFKTAVDRNRIKRLMREAWRLQKNELKRELAKQNRRMDVFLIYTGKELPVYSEVSSTIQKIIEKLFGITTNVR